MKTDDSTPVPVLVLAGLDPVNGAGLGADLEAIRSGGGWALTVPTALTVQDSANVAALREVDADYLQAAVSLACADIAPRAIKLGLLCGDASLAAVVAIRAQWPDIPCVIDPVLKAGGGSNLATEALVTRLRERLVPQATLITPNRHELARLVPELDSDDARAGRLSQQGPAVLLTGTDPVEGESPTDQVTHRLYQHGTLVTQWQWPRLAGSYHGSGCTLAARLALLLAQGMPLMEACTAAQRYTLAALKAAHALGHGQWLPERWRP